MNTDYNPTIRLARHAGASISLEVRHYCAVGGVRCAHDDTEFQSSPESSGKMQDMKGSEVKSSPVKYVSSLSRHDSCSTLDPTDNRRGEPMSGSAEGGQHIILSSGDSIADEMVREALRYAQDAME